MKEYDELTPEEKILHHQKEILGHHRKIKAIRLNHKKYYNYQTTDLELGVIDKWKKLYEVNDLSRRDRVTVQCKVDIIKELIDRYSRTFQRVGFAIGCHHASVMYLYNKY